MKFLDKLFLLCALSSSTTIVVAADDPVKDAPLPTTVAPTVVPAERQVALRRAPSSQPDDGDISLCFLGGFGGASAAEFASIVESLQRVSRAEPRTAASAVPSSPMADQIRRILTSPYPIVQSIGIDTTRPSHPSPPLSSLGDASRVEPSSVRGSFWSFQPHSSLGLYWSEREASAAGSLSADSGSWIRPRIEDTFFRGGHALCILGAALDPRIEYRRAGPSSVMNWLKRINSKRAKIEAKIEVRKEFEPKGGKAANKEAYRQREKELMHERLRAIELEQRGMHEAGLEELMQEILRAFSLIEEGYTSADIEQHTIRFRIPVDPHPTLDSDEERVESHNRQRAKQLARKEVRRFPLAERDQELRELEQENSEKRIWSKIIESQIGLHSSEILERLGDFPVDSDAEETETSRGGKAASATVPDIVEMDPVERLLRIVRGEEPSAISQWLKRINSKRARIEAKIQVRKEFKPKGGRAADKEAYRQREKKLMHERLRALKIEQQGMEEYMEEILRVMQLEERGERLAAIEDTIKFKIPVDPGPASDSDDERVTSRNHQQASLAASRIVGIFQPRLDRLFQQESEQPLKQAFMQLMQQDFEQLIGGMA